MVLIANVALNSWISDEERTGMIKWYKVTTVVQSTHIFSHGFRLFSSLLRLTTTV